jgi:signal peptidase I
MEGDSGQETHLEAHVDQKGESTSAVRQIAREALEIILLAFLLFWGINSVSARIRVQSISMLPTLQPEDFVIVNKLAYNFGQPQRGDIVVFNLPQGNGQRYIKRAVGLPGETIRIIGGRVYINDQMLTEPYLSGPTNRGGTWEIPENAVFVMGDNRNNSSDSRSWGVVPFDKVIGKAWIVYWPPAHWQALGGK